MYDNDNHLSFKVFCINLIQHSAEWHYSQNMSFLSLSICGGGGGCGGAVKSTRILRRIQHKGSNIEYMIEFQRTCICGLCIGIL